LAEGLQPEAHFLAENSISLMHAGLVAGLFGVGGGIVKVGSLPYTHTLCPDSAWSFRMMYGLISQSLLYA